jgi:hypothetical protein
MNDFFLLVQENQVNWKEHPDRMNTPRGNDPESGSKPSPPLGFTEQADQAPHVAVRDDRFRRYERLSRLVIYIDHALLVRPDHGPHESL